MANITVREVSKHFSLDHSLGGESNPEHTRHCVLKDISFDISEGECVGIIGKNGSGKSTLLRLLAGILQPDSGSIDISGRVLPLIELQAGIQGELTGRDNIFLMGSILGLSKETINKHLSRIIDFSGLGKFIDVKYKKYSEGMKLRLAFSIVIFVPHDILLIDEILSVGDEEFQKKSSARLEELRLQGKTIVIVSHDLKSITEKCDWALLLDEGKILSKGNPERVVSTYLKVVGKKHSEQMREKIQAKLEQINRLDRVSRKEGPKKKSILSSLRDALFNQREPDVSLGKREYLLEETKCIAKDYECLLKGRHNHLRTEHRNLLGELKEQRRLEELQENNDHIIERIQEKIESAEKEIREILDEEHFLLKVKITLGERNNRHQDERRQLAERISCSIDEASNHERKNLSKTYLHILKDELNQPLPLNTLIPVVGDFAEACFNILRVEDDSERRKDVCDQFLETLGHLLEDASDEESWIVERLFEQTSERMVSSAILPEEGGFRSSYVKLFRDALFKTETSAARERISRDLVKILRAGIVLIEEEIDSHSHDENQKESQENDRRRQKKENLLLIQKQLVQDFNEHLSATNESGVTPESTAGLQDVKIIGCSILTDEDDGTIKESNIIKSGSPTWARIRYHIQDKEIRGLRITVTIHHETGLQILTPTHIISKKDLLIEGKENEATVLLLDPRVPLYPGRYLVTVALYVPENQQPQDYHSMSYEFEIIDAPDEEEENDQKINNPPKTTQN